MPWHFPKAYTTGHRLFVTPFCMDAPDDVHVALGEQLAGLRVGSRSRSDRKGKGKDKASSDEHAHDNNHWFWRPGSKHPYELEAVSTDDADVMDPLTIFHFATYFPWPLHPPEFVGDQYERRATWDKLATKWHNVVAIAGTNQIRLVRTSDEEPFQVLLAIHLARPPPPPPPPASDKTKKKRRTHNQKFDMEDRAIAITWAIDPLSLSPLICFGGFAGLIYVFDLNSNTVRSRIRGHGGGVMHMTTHLSLPHIIASCSRDRSTRITDLTIPQDHPITYPPHPDGSPNLGNFPMGGEPQKFPPPDYLRLQSAEGSSADILNNALPEGPEGSGPGRCIATLGWWMEGHRESVSCSDFHPTLPLIATGGLDHATIIWPLPRLSVHQPQAKYEFAPITDPLFKTSLIHKSALDSIYWLSKDTLISKSWEPTSRTGARCAIWRWTQLGRFFPAGGKPRVWGSLSSITFLRHTYDVDNSRLFHILGDIPEVNSSRYSRLAIHRPLHPKLPHVDLPIQDLLIAIPADSEVGVIDLWNPCLAESLMVEAIAEEQGMDVDSAITGRWVLSEGHLRGRLPLKQIQHGNHLLKTQVKRVPLRCVAISPRGARWIVGVGEGGIITVWKMQDV